MKNEASIYDRPLNTPAEWGAKFNATEHTYSSKDDRFSEHMENMLNSLPEKRKMNINSFLLSNNQVKHKFIYAIQRVSEMSKIEITINGRDPNCFVFFKNEKIN
jgi:hypothetical protein